MLLPYLIMYNNFFRIRTNEDEKRISVNVNKPRCKTIFEKQNIGIMHSTLYFWKIYIDRKILQVDLTALTFLLSLVNLSAVQ